MSNSNIPTCKLPDEECNILFNSIVDKLKIENPTFFYPIYKKIVGNESTSSEELKNIILDSKYKCKKIIEKIIDSDDDDEVFSSDDEEMSELDNEEETDNNKNITNEDTDKTILNVLNETIQDIPLENEDNIVNTDILDYDDYNDKEIEEAINNTFLATAIIEKINKQTGEKECKEEIIHIKKTALLDPLRVMQDEFVIPAKIQNKNLDDDTLKNTNSKLNSYNNCGHVESLFLYLGNKLVETGKCPSFPYYYGCINGEDPNYHHNITDEYESISRTKWFKDRIKNDFDLLIIEDDDSDCETENKNIRRPSNCSEFNIDSDSETKTETKESEKETETETETETKESENENEKEIDLTFIKDIDNDDFNLDIDLLNETETPTETSTETPIETPTETSTEEQSKKQSKEQSEEQSEEQIGGTNEKDTNDDESESEKSDTDEDNSDEETDDDDDFIEELSDIDEDNLSITDFEDKPGSLYYVKCEKMPVSLSLMEKLDETLDNMLDDDYNMSETEWFGMFFQVAFGLAVAQKYFNFVHNDLHSSNIMFKKTLLKYLYFQVNNQYYRIPTYGKITKIIDFARGTFKLGDRWVFSDQFKEDGDAFGQYDYPVDGSLKNCEHKPNPSFDLVRLGTTVIQRLDELPKVREFVEQITLDDYENSVCYDEDTFELYVDIAHNCHKAIPIEVMERPEFKKFKINKQNVPKGQYVFKY